MPVDSPRPLVPTGLDGHVVIITGSSRGIGAATARIADGLGARVILHGQRASPELAALAAELDARSITCDAADAEAVQAVLRDVLESEPQVHALINCAGRINPRPFLESDDEDWMVDFRVNLFGVVHFCQALAPAMVAAGYGRIVNVTSIRGNPTTASARGMAYSASKAAVSNFTSALAKELAPAVNVNAVAPGFINTRLSATWPESVWQQAQSALAGRVAEPSEIGHLLAFLASDRASFITGQTIVADGGYTIAGK